MREIKFRAWDSERQEMVSFQELFGKNIGGIHWDNSKGILHPMQFTGLIDKNQKEIYEGDILRHPDSNNLYRIGFNIDTASYEFFKMDLSDRLMAHFKSMANYCEIIGNVHENPDLLSKPQQ